MRWIITHDYLGGAGVPSRVGYGQDLAGMFIQLPAELVAQTAEALPVKLRLYDDDGKLYYTGRCADLSDADEDAAFAPLNWAMNDAGCTRMDHLESGVWRTL